MAISGMKAMTTHLAPLRMRTIQGSDSFILDLIFSNNFGSSWYNVRLGVTEPRMYLLSERLDQLKLCIVNGKIECSRIRSLKGGRDIRFNASSALFHTLESKAKSDSPRAMRISALPPCRNSTTLNIGSIYDLKLKYLTCVISTNRPL